MATRYWRRSAVADPWSRRVAAAVRGGKHRGVPRRSVMASSGTAPCSLATSPDTCLDPSRSLDR